MGIEELFNDKSIKSKEKTATLGQWLLNGSLPADELLAFAAKAKDAVKANCIEALEYASKKNPVVVDETVLEFVTKTLAEKAPRIKWESAKVIGNMAHLFPEKLEKPVEKLLLQAKHEGTVVRWSAAFALGEIVKLKTRLN